MNIRKLTAISILSIIWAVGAVASPKVTLSNSTLLRMAEYESAPTGRSGMPADTVLALVETSSAQALADLGAIGVNTVNIIGDFALVRLPLDKFEKVTDIEDLVSIDFGQPTHLLMDNARRYGKVDDVHKGTEGRQPYTGKGVLVGIIDTGLDPLNPAFLDADGNKRVDMYTYCTEDGEMFHHYTREAMARIETDNENDTHGTHVSGIATGSRIANAIVPKYTKPDETGHYRQEEPGPGDLPYYGVAYDADIMMSGGSFATTALLSSLSAQVSRAAELGKPAVINLSVGTNIGPHDGTSSFSRAVEELGKEAIIVIAAGNEGNANVSFRYKATDYDNRIIRIFIDTKGIKENNKLENHFVEFRTDNPNQKPSVKLIGYNKSTMRDEFAYLVKSTSDPSFSANSYYPFDETIEAKIKKYFMYTNLGGVVRLAPENGNYMGWLYMNGLYPRDTNTDVVLGFELELQPGVTVTGYTTDEAPFTDAGVEGALTGTPEMSISDLATGNNIITVGSYNSRNVFPAIDDQKFYGYNTELFMPSSFSSYGTMDDGSTLPHVAAPGSVVIAPLNRYYTAGHAPNKYSAMVLDPSDNEKMTSYYQAMQGTSMATPFVTGTIALWLEADPTLTVDDVKDIIAKTSIKDKYYDDPENAIKLGAGRIDALEGLKEVLIRRYGTGISDVSTDAASSEGLIDFDGSHVSAFLAGASMVAIKVVSPSGVQVASTTATGSEAVVDMSSLAPGIYIINVTDGGRRSLSRKVALQ